MRALIPTVILGAAVLGFQDAKPKVHSGAGGDSAEQVAASTYEHLASAIIEIEATEDELVKSILIGYHTAAQYRLRAAVANAQNRAANLEAAATEISNIANEGDKRIQAVRQRLAKAGHTHNTDVETKEDYMFVNSRERKELLALASKIGRAGANAQPAELQGFAKELGQLFRKAIAAE